MHIKRFLGKIASTFLAISAVSVSATAAADVVYPSHDGGWGHANYYGDSSCCPQQCAPACCPQNDCCCTPVPPPCLGVAYNPAGYLQCCGNNCNPCCNNGFFDSLRVSADFLWWRACEECLCLGTEEFFSEFPSGGSRYQKSREKNPDYKYDPGFRIGLASICPCDCFDVALNWTHYHTKATAEGESHFDTNPRSNNGTSPTAFQEVVFIPCWQRIGNAIPDFCKGKWTLTLDLLDLEFGRKYYVSNCFILRPHLGLRGTRIDQSFRTFSEANRFDPYEGPFSSGFFTSESKAKNDFLGIGPRIGLDLELTLPCACGIKVFGQAAGSLVFGRFERHSREFFHDFSSSRDPSVYDNFPSNLEYHATSTKDRCSRAITDLAIGLKWEHCCNWCNRCHPITIAVAWEHHAFYDFNNFIFEKGFRDPNFADFKTFGVAGEHKCCCGDLTTQGLTVHAEVGF